MSKKKHHRHSINRKIALLLGTALLFESISVGGTAAYAEEQTVVEILEDSGGDMIQTEATDTPAKNDAPVNQTDTGDASAQNTNIGEVAAEEDGSGQMDTELVTDSGEPEEHVMPEEVGESIKEIIQASAELAEADDAGVERLGAYIEETKEQFEALPEEGQAVLQESIAALDNAAVAVEVCQDAAKQMEETGTITIDPDGKENSFRYLNGVPIDESLIAVEEEIDAAAELDPEDLYPETEEEVITVQPAAGEEASGQTSQSGTGSQLPAQENTSETLSDAAGDAGADADENRNGQSGQAQSEKEVQQSAGTENDIIIAEPESGETSGAETDTKEQGGEGAAASPDANGTEGNAAEPSGTGAGSSTAGEPVSVSRLQKRELPKADIALVKTAAGDRLVELDGSTETQNILTASTQVHKGIDVSHHNGSIDWDRVKKAGIEFAIIRCGHGHNLSTGGDAYWLRNISEAERVGMPYGIYFYSYATTVAGVRKEAATTVKLLKGHKPSLPVFYDMEDVTQKGLSNKLKNQMATAYCDDVTAAGYKAGLYSYKYWLEGYMSTFISNTNYPIWVAQYSSKTTYKGDYCMWQYTSRGKVDGIPGYVDMNYWYGKLKAVARKTSPQIVVDTLNSRLNLQPDTRIAQVTSADQYTQKQVSPGNWIIVKNVTETEPELQLYGFVYIPSLGKICYFDPSTGFKAFGQKVINGKYYLFDDTSGAMQVGFRYLEEQGKIVFYNAQGQMQFGKQYIGGYWHYFNTSSGAMKRNAFQKLTKKKKCYYNDYGRAVSGEKKIGKYYYYFDPKTFAMKTGIVKVAGKKKTCYYNKKGHRKTGLVKIKGKKYYFKPSNGAMIKKKFKKIKGKKYYFNKKGRMVFGRQKIKGKWYTFDRKTGALIG